MREPRLTLPSQSCIFLRLLSVVNSFGLAARPVRTHHRPLWPAAFRFLPRVRRNSQEGFSSQTSVGRPKLRSSVKVDMSIHLSERFVNLRWCSQGRLVHPDLQREPVSFAPWIAVHHRTRTRQELLCMENPNRSKSAVAVSSHPLMDCSYQDVGGASGPGGTSIRRGLRVMELPASGARTSRAVSRLFS